MTAEPVLGAPRPQVRATQGLREALRATIKETIWLGVRFEQGPQPNIGLFCSRRGGSTWLMEIIGANRGMLPLNQPVEAFTPNLTPYQYSRLPAFDRGAIIHPDAQELRELRAYTDELAAGRMRVNAPHAFWRRDFSWRTSRMVFKILSAKPMMDWFEATYGLDVVYLLRHPVPQSLSCIRNGWGTSSKAYLRNEWFVEEVIASPAAVDFARRIADHGSDLEQMVLNWTLENLYPLRVLADRPSWLTIAYEEVVTDRERVFSEVSERLGLQDLDRMRRAADRASRSSGLSVSNTRDAIAGQDQGVLAGGWQSKIDSEQVREVGRVLDAFDVTVYSPSSVLPNWSGYRPEMVG
ncbi:MAG: hypothetical protein NTV23_09255 [Propionibacteriales bacterium]|nr:hypothetical protein [Propionibacteriales bacterium]